MKLQQVFRTFLNSDFLSHTTWEQGMKCDKPIVVLYASHVATRVKVHSIRKSDFHRIPAESELELIAITI